MNNYAEPNGSPIAGNVDEAFTCDISVILRILNERDHKGLEWSIVQKGEIAGVFSGSKLIVQWLNEFEARAIASAYMRTVTLLQPPQAKGHTNE